MEREGKECYWVVILSISVSVLDVSFSFFFLLYDDDDSLGLAASRICTKPFDMDYSDILNGEHLTQLTKECYYGIVVLMS